MILIQSNKINYISLSILNSKYFLLGNFINVQNQIALSLGIFIIFSSCKKDHSNPEETPPDVVQYDDAATAFITSSGITDTLQKSAINDLVVQLKKDSLWDKFLALYPMVGGTDATTKWNLKDPRDLDDAFRISWNGTPDFKSTGVTCLTATDWGDTHLNDSILHYDNSSISFYSGTQNAIAGYDMGCSNGIFPYNILAYYENLDSDIVNTWFNAYDNVSYQPANTIGLSMNSSIDGEVVHYVNGAAVKNYGAPDEAYTKQTITIGQVLDDSRMGLKECRFASIGQGLTASQALKFYNAVQAFQTKLGR